MHKIYKYLLLMALVLLGISYGAVAMAMTKVAVLPLVNKVKNDEAAPQFYYGEIIQTLTHMDDFYFEDGDRVTESIERNVKEGQMPKPEVLARIAQEGQVDMVYVMELDKLGDKPIHRNSGDHKSQLQLRGRSLAYYAKDGRIFERSFSDDKTILASMRARRDWVHEEFARHVSREIKTALKHSLSKEEREAKEREEHQKAAAAWSIK